MSLLQETSTSTLKRKKSNHRRSVSSSNAYVSLSSSSLSSSSVSISQSLLSTSLIQQTDSPSALEIDTSLDDTANKVNSQTPPSPILAQHAHQHQSKETTSTSSSSIVLPVSILVNQNTNPKASSKSNDKFHKLFPSVPIEEYVIESMTLKFIFFSG